MLLFTQHLIIGFTINVLMFLLHTQVSYLAEPDVASFVVVSFLAENGISGFGLSLIRTSGLGKLKNPQFYPGFIEVI